MSPQEKGKQTRPNPLSFCGGSCWEGPSGPSETLSYSPLSAGHAQPGGEGEGRCSECI